MIGDQCPRVKPWHASGFAAVRQSLPPMNHRCVRAAALLAAALIVVAGLHAAPLKVDHYLRSVPANMVSGYILAETPPVRKIESGEVVMIETIGGGGGRKDESSIAGPASSPVIAVAETTSASKGGAQ